MKRISRISEHFLKFGVLKVKQNGEMKFLNNLSRMIIHQVSIKNSSSIVSEIITQKKKVYHNHHQATEQPFSVVSVKTLPLRQHTKFFF